MSLRKALIKLAQKNPDGIRSHLVPILRKQAILTPWNHTEDEYDAAVEFMNTELEKIPAGLRTAWWAGKDSAYLVNMPMMGGAQIHAYTILSPVPSPVKFSAGEDEEYPAGVVIQPDWWTIKDGIAVTENNIRKVVEIIQKADSIKKKIADEVKLIERKYKISIPSNVQQNIVAYCMKIAKGRIAAKTPSWKRPGTLFPYDGSKHRPIPEMFTIWKPR